jgi:hypothetical protein
MNPVSAIPSHLSPEESSTVIVMPEMESKSDRKARRASLQIPRLPFHEKGCLNPQMDVSTPRLWNNPGIDYIKEKSIFGIEDFRSLVAMSKLEWIFLDYAFSIEAAHELKKYLISEQCRIHSIKFVNCAVGPQFFKELTEGLQQSRSVKFLHFEGCVLSKTIAGYLKQALSSGCHALRTLHFINVSMSPEALEEVADGIIAQNSLITSVINEERVKDPMLSSLLTRVCQRCGIYLDALQLTFNDLLRLFSNSSMMDSLQIIQSLLEDKTGLRELSLEGCRLDDKHAQALGELIAKSTRLKSLNLLGNQLGSGKRFVVGMTPLDSLRVQHLRQSPSQSIAAIVEGLTHNTTLINLILSSNKLSIHDWKALYQVVEESKSRADFIEHVNSTVTINVTGNDLEKQSHHHRLIVIGSSPRSMSCPKNLPGTPRLIQKTPQERRSSNESSHSAVSNISAKVFIKDPQ